MEKEAGPRRGQHADVTCWQPLRSFPQLPLATPSNPHSSVPRTPFSLKADPILPSFPWPLAHPPSQPSPSPGASTAPSPWFWAHLCPSPRRQPGLMLEPRATGPGLSLSFPPRVTSTRAVPGRGVGSQGTRSRSHSSVQKT